MFKHIATGHYLCCDGKGKLYMGKNYSSDEAHWNIHPFKVRSPFHRLRMGHVSVHVGVSVVWPFMLCMSVSLSVRAAL